MQKILTVKGTKDLLGRDLEFHEKILKIFTELCNFFAYQKVSTPIIENASVFIKSLGKSSDIIEKEMYSFVDKGGENIVLRPEGTAAIARALITNNQQEEQKKKYFYCGPMFRREKPQSGRLRQFHQIGVEYFGKRNFHNDLEVIILAEKVLTKLDIRDKVKLEINTLGNLSSREGYKKVLKDFFLDNKSSLSNESLKRLEVNPFRILDSKDDSDKKLIDKAPKNLDYLDNESNDFFSNLLEGLNKLKINYKINPYLVRGLDYYNHTAFEYITFDDKSQNALLAGGRYDGLVKSLGGQDISGVGWAAGVERLLLNITEFKELTPRLISFFSMSENFNNQLLELINGLDILELTSVNFISSGNFKKKLVKANKTGSLGCVILGDDEWKKGMLIWKDFFTGKQEIFFANDLNNFLKKKIEKNKHCG